MNITDVVVAFLTALILLPIISMLTSKLSSLPVDCATAAICLIATLAAKVSEMQKLQHGPINYEWPSILFLFVLFSLVFMTICLGFHFVHNKVINRTSHFGKACTYFVSLSASVIYLWLSYRAIINTDDVFSINIAGKGELVQIAKIVVGDVSVFIAAGWLLGYALVFTVINGFILRRCE